MERAMTTDEKIRRAEEIYQRRRINESRKTTARVNVADAPKDYGLFKKMVLQIMVCICVYFIFFLIKNSNYIFSEEFMKKAQDVLSYDINLQEQCNSILNFFEEQEEMESSNNEVMQEIQTEIETLSAVSEEAATEKLEEESSSISQTLTDAQEILKNYSLIKPLTRNHYIKIWLTKSNNRNCP